MTKIDLITGFLGSGKTTFLKIYAQYLMRQGMTIGILENDYGAVNVDMMLLSELEGDNCELEMVAGGCHEDCHRRRFKTKLIALGMSGYDRVIVEPSGIFDIDEFYDVLNEEPLNRMYGIGNVIAIVDARLSDSMSCESDFYLASQIATAGTILLSRCQLTDIEHINSTQQHLVHACELVHSGRVISDIINTTPWDLLTDDDLASVASCGYYPSSYEKSIAGKASPYSSVYFLELPFTTKIIRSMSDNLLHDDIYGNVFRIKGFYRENDEWFEINATKNDFDLQKIKLGQEVIIVIGEDLNTSLIDEYVKSCI